MPRPRAPRTAAARRPPPRARGMMASARAPRGEAQCPPDAAARSRPHEVREQELNKQRQRRTPPLIGASPGPVLRPRAHGAARDRGRAACRTAPWSCRAGRARGAPDARAAPAAPGASAGAAAEQARDNQPAGCLRRSETRTISARRDLFSGSWRGG
jgi:hypothetical protein